MVNVVNVMNSNFTMNNDLVAYYAARAREYEKIYDRTERQPDLTRLTAIVQDIFRDKNVLEIACGTGWWTQRIARTARAMLATDINEAVLDIARAKNYESGNVHFQCDDLFQSAVEQPFDALFGGYIWSHIRLEDLDRFIACTIDRVKPGGVVVFADNLYVPGSNTPISETDAAGNTYQTRLLEDGSEYAVLKNFPNEQLVREKLESRGLECEWLALDYYWIAIGKVRATF